jgi:hypothetical protein
VLVLPDAFDGAKTRSSLSVFIGVDDMLGEL